MESSQKRAVVRHFVGPTPRNDSVGFAVAPKAAGLGRHDSGQVLFRCQSVVLVYLADQQEQLEAPPHVKARAGVAGDDGVDRAE